MQTQVTGEDAVEDPIPGLGSTPEKIIRQAERAEADGFTSLWYATGVGGDSMTAMAFSGRATTRIELGTAVMQTYACHPVLQASRSIAAALAIGTPGRFTLGVGPSHAVFVESMLGLSYGHPGRYTDEYVQVVAPVLRGQRVAFVGEEFRVYAGAIPSSHPLAGDGSGVPKIAVPRAPVSIRSHLAVWSRPDVKAWS